MSPRTTIVLVAKREITTRLRSKALIWTTVIMLVAIIGGSFVTSLLQDKVPETQVASEFVGVTDEALIEAVEAAAHATGSAIGVKQVTADNLDAQLREKAVAAVVEQSSSGTLDVTVLTDLPGDLSATMTVLAQQLALDHAVTALGGDPAAVNAAVLGAEPALHTLDPSDKPAVEIDPIQSVIGMIAGILIFIGVMTTGQMVAQGVVEEKSSRVVELLLSTIRPWQLIAGKVLGIGTVGLVQIGLLVGAGAGSSSAFGLLDGLNIPIGSAALWLLVWFGLGYAMYATMLGALASLVSRQEDVGAVLTPVIFMMMIPYLVGVTVAPWEPENMLVIALSLIPVFSPLLMPIRIAIGAAPAWQIALSVGLTVATIALLVVLAGKVYSRAVLRTGARVPLKEVLRRTES